MAEFDLMVVLVVDLLLQDMIVVAELVVVVHLVAAFDLVAASVVDLLVVELQKAYFQILACL